MSTSSLFLFIVKSVHCVLVLYLSVCLFQTRITKASSTKCWSIVFMLQIGSINISNLPICEFFYYIQYLFLLWSYDQSPMDEWHDFYTWLSSQWMKNSQNRVSIRSTRRLLRLSIIAVYWRQICFEEQWWATHAFYPRTVHCPALSS